MTVVDGNLVSDADLGNNFFLDPSCLGENRTKSVVDFLKELNSDVETFISEYFIYFLYVTGLNTMERIHAVLSRETYRSFLNLTLSLHQTWKIDLF